MVTLTRKELKEILFRCRFEETVAIVRSLRVSKLVEDAGFVAARKVIDAHPGDFTYDQKKKADVVRLSQELNMLVDTLKPAVITEALRFYGWKVTITEDHAEDEIVPNMYVPQRGFCTGN